MSLLRREPVPAPWGLWLFCAVALGLATMPGCSRGFYRLQADAQVAALLAESASRVDRPLGRMSIQIDPRSRMFDPFCPDHEPLPPDDPAAHQLMHCVDCKRGYPGWHKNGDTDLVQGPNWLAALPVNDEGEPLMTLDDAVRVALLNSRSYQSNLEELYLSALDVSFERFRFDAQFFGGYTALYTADGRARSGGGGNSKSVLNLSTFPSTRGVLVNRMTTTGGELVVGLANSLVWQFSGPDNYTGTTLLDFALVQPLLRAGGRARVMERLTIAERSLLSNVRQMERYRHGFYLQIAAGEQGVPGPSRRGGFFGGSGLEGFSGVGGGGFGRVGNQGNNNAGGGFAGGAGAAAAGGYMGLLQSQQNIKNQEANIAALRSSLAQLEAFFAAGRIDFFQVQLARQALFNAQSQLLTARAQYESTLDQFKITIGLPPTLNLRIEDQMLDQFNLIDAAIVPAQNRLTDAQQQVGQTILSMLPEQEVAAGPVGSIAPPIAWSPALAEGLRKLKSQLEAVNTLRQQVIKNNLPRAREDLEKLDSVLDQRVTELQRLHQRLRQRLAGQPQGGELIQGLPNEEIDRGVTDVDSLKQLPELLDNSLVRISQRLEERSQSLGGLIRTIDDLLREGPTLDPAMLNQRLRTGVLSPAPNELTGLSADVLELSLVQARARTESSVLVPVRLRSDDAIAIARHNRLDWMNARSALVDAYRLIEFNANDLLSTADIVFSGDIGNVGDNPLKLRDTTGRLRVGIQFDAPLTRLSERNTYRQSLIEFQQARRTYYLFEDSVAQQLRNILRTIELNQLNFELRRAAVHVAIAQVELTRLRLQEPPKPAVDQVFGATTARDLVSALSDLLNVQNDFLSVWVNYEVQRRDLDRDLGTMELNAEGLWVDPGPVDENFARQRSAGEDFDPLPGESLLPCPPADAPRDNDGTSALLDSDGRQGAIGTGVVPAGHWQSDSASSAQTPPSAKSGSADSSRPQLDPAVLESLIWTSGTKWRNTEPPPGLNHPEEEGARGARPPLVQRLRR